MSNGNSKMAERKEKFTFRTFRTLPYNKASNGKSRDLQNSSFRTFRYSPYI